MHESCSAFAISEQDKGTAFEKLVAVWLVTDPAQSKRFERVETWWDWARQRGLDRTDTGIDLVGTPRGGRFAAIQWKFLDSERRIRKEDIDSIISAPAKLAFAERLIVETTGLPCRSNAETMLHGKTVPTSVIGIRSLRDSQVDWSVFAASGRIASSRKRCG